MCWWWVFSQRHREDNCEDLSWLQTYQSLKHRRRTHCEPKCIRWYVTSSWAYTLHISVRHTHTHAPTHTHPSWPAGVVNREYLQWVQAALSWMRKGDYKANFAFFVTNKWTLNPIKHLLPLEDKSATYWSWVYPTWPVITKIMGYMNILNWVMLHRMIMPPPQDS